MQNENNEINKEENKKQKIIKSGTKKGLNIKKNYSEEYILSLLQKAEKNRTKNEIRILSEYLSEKYDYFKKIKNSSQIQKLEKIISVLHYEIFHKGDPIILFGEEGDKFYILIEGRVNLYRPIYPQKLLTLQEYIIYLNNIKNDDKTGLIFNRVIEKNKNLNIDINFYMSIPIAEITHYGKMNFFIEENEKLGEFNNGFAFGEIALIKKTTRNATIIAIDDCKLVSINKTDYNKIMKELELKRLEKDLKLFKIHYPFFSFWSLNHLIKLFNGFSKEVLYNTDYLYKQNEESKYIYIIENGVFEIYCLLSLGWIEEYYNYINYNKSNLINYLIGKFPVSEEEINNLYNLAKENIIESPMTFNPYKQENYTISNPKKLNFLDFEQQQIEKFDKYNLFKIKIKTISNYDLIGFEDALELKKRFFFVKCISEKAQILKVKTKDFHNLISTLDNENNKKFFIEVINTRKDNFLKIIKNEVDLKLNRINHEFDKTFKDFLKAKGKFSYDKLEEKKKSKYVVKEINYKKNKILNNERLLNINLRRKQNRSLTHLKTRNLTMSKLNLPNLTYSNFSNFKKQENKEIPPSDNNITNINTRDYSKENNSNYKIKKLEIPINLKTIENSKTDRKIFKKLFEQRTNSNDKISYHNISLTNLNPEKNKSSRNKNNSFKLFNTEKYIKNLGKNDKFLKKEVIKLAGITKKIPKKIVNKKNENLLRIERKFVSPEINNKIRNINSQLTEHFSQGSFSTTNFSNYLKIPNTNNINTHNNKNKIFINKRIRAELRMKDFRSLRLKKKFK